MPKFHHWTYPNSRNLPLAIDMHNGSSVNNFLSATFSSMSFKVKQIHLSVVILFLFNYFYSYSRSTLKGHLSAPYHYLLSCNLSIIPFNTMTIISQFKLFLYGTNTGDHYVVLTITFTSNSLGHLGSTTVISGWSAMVLAVLSIISCNSDNTSSSNVTCCWTEFSQLSLNISIKSMLLKKVKDWVYSSA